MLPTHITITKTIFYNVHFFLTNYCNEHLKRKVRVDNLS